VLPRKPLANLLIDSVIALLIAFFHNFHQETRMNPTQDQQDLFSLIQHDGSDHAVSRRRFYIPHWAQVLPPQPCRYAHKP
jgi:hypothetical protein